MVRSALNRFAREVSMTFLSEHYDRKRFRERPTLFRLKDGRRSADLIFTSFAHERLHLDAKESDQALFQYSIGPDPRDGSRLDLFRRVKPLLDEEPERGGDQEVLAEGVLGFTVEYHAFAGETLRVVQRDEPAKTCRRAPLLRKHPRSRCDVLRTARELL